MYAQEDTENRRFKDNVALSKGIKEFIALAAGQQMRIEHHSRTAQLAGSELSQKRLAVARRAASATHQCNPSCILFTNV